MDASPPFVLLFAGTPARVVVVRAEGELDGHYAPRFRDQVDAALRIPHTRAVIIDLSAVPLCGAMGIAELLHADRHSRHAQASLLLIGVRQAVLERLATAGLATLFTIHPTLAESLAHLRV
ncbi:STAS domain-containing protein [Streptosporangium algeriense]|uniref:Anti-sigma factor antagonist n=1 Tax=Streptosporangium algeriense TaxID=1682748 RepID=A0ABW3DNI8_9ACTN